MATMTYMEASRQALIEEMRRDDRVWAVGEDLGRGGVFGQYKGLVDEFGAGRIADAPISEACIMGAATGAAMMGSRPVVEMRFSDFALCATEIIVYGSSVRVCRWSARGCSPWPSRCLSTV